MKAFENSELASWLISERKKSTINNGKREAFSRVIFEAGMPIEGKTMTLPTLLIFTTLKTQE